MFFATDNRQPKFEKLYSKLNVSNYVNNYYCTLINYTRFDISLEIHNQNYLLHFVALLTPNLARCESCATTKQTTLWHWRRHTNMKLTVHLDLGFECLNFKKTLSLNLIVLHRDDSLYVKNGSLEFGRFVLAIVLQCQQCIVFWRIFSMTVLRKIQPTN